MQDDPLFEGIVDPWATDQARRQTLDALKPLTTEVAACRDDPRLLASLLDSMHTKLLTLPPLGLRLCIDYALFPLFIIVESAFKIRASEVQPSSSSSSSSSTSSTKPRLPASVPIPSASSDRVFEAALRCIATVLDRSGPLTFHDASLAVSFLRQWNGVTALPRDRTTEEARELIVRSLRTVFESAATNRDVCAVLADESNAPLLGNLLSALLSTAKGELEAGPQGSRALTRTCVQTVAVVVGALTEHPESLAFFVPGLTGGLVGVILTGTGTGTADKPTKGELSVPAGGAALASAFAALSTTLTATLSDRSLPESVCAELDRRTSSTAASTPSAAQQPAEVLAALQSLALHAAEKERAAAEGENAAKARPPPPMLPGRLRVHRTADWVEFTSERVDPVLRIVVSRLLGHPSPQARSALATGALSLLQNCTKSLGALPSCSKALVEAILTLAGDEVAEVSGPCRTALGRAAESQGTTAGPPSPLAAHVEVAASYALSMWLQLPSVLRSASIEAALQHTSKAAAALEVLGPERVARLFLHDPTTQQKVVTALLKCFAFHQEEAGLMLQAGAPSVFVSPPSSSAPASASSAPPLPPVKLPRMPLGLRYTSQHKLYEGIAKLPRFLGRAAIITEACQSSPTVSSADLGSPFTALLRSLLATYRKATAAATKPASAAPEAALQSWQLQSASILTAVQEVVHGASDQWTEDFLTGSSSSPSLWDFRAAPIPATPPPVASETAPSPQHDDVVTLDGFTPPRDEGEEGRERGPFGLGLEDLMHQDELEFFATSVAEPAPAAPPPPPPSDLREECAALIKGGVQTVQQELFEGRAARAVWALHTSLPDGDLPPSTPAAPSRLNLQQLGENATILRALLECVGVLGGALGPAFAQSAKLLAPALLPALTRLVDGSLSVRGSAEACLANLVRRCGFSDLDDLVRRNGDWIVDDICRQLRALDAHPHAPQLLSSLMQRAKVAADLLPLMAEPLRLSLSGIGLLARSKHPEHTQAFTRSLRELSRGVRDEGSRLLASSCGRYRARHDFLELYPHTKPSVSVPVAAENAKGTTTSLPEIRDFFAQKREQRKDRKEAGLQDDPSTYQPGSLEPLESVRDLPPAVAGAVWIELDAEERRYRAAGSLAASIVENVAPLVTNPDLATSLLALECAVTAVQGLQGAADTVKLNDQYRRVIGLKERELRGVTGEKPQLLPTVHHLWPYLLMALRDARLPLVIAALGHLPRLTHLAGADFMSRRIAKEAWPSLARLVQGGRPLPAAKRAPATTATASRPTVGGDVLVSAASADLADHARVATEALKALGPLASGQVSLVEDDVSPGAQLQLRTAVLQCLEVMGAPAGGGDPTATVGTLREEERRLVGRRRGQDCVRQVVGDMMEATVGFLGKGQPLPLQEQAVRTFQALVPHDESAAWLLLTDIARSDKTVALADLSAVTSTQPPPTLPPKLETGLRAYLDEIRAATDPAKGGPMALRLPLATVAATRAHVLPPSSALLQPFRSGGIRDSGYAGVVEMARMGQCGPRAVKLLEWMEQRIDGGRASEGVVASAPLWVRRVILPQAPKPLGSQTGVQQDGPLLPPEEGEGGN